MITVKLAVRTLCVSALAGFVTLGAHAAFANTPEPPGLFQSHSTSTKQTLPKQSVAGRSRAVTMDYKQLQKSRFFVSLPGGVSFEAVRNLKKDHGKGRFSWVGHASGDPKNEVIMGVSGDAVAGTFSYRGKLFKLEPRANGSHVLSEVKTTAPAPELDPVSVADSNVVNADLPGTSGASADSNGQALDVLVAYTPAVQALYGTQGAEALILQAIAETNQAYSNSGMSTRLNLVHSVLTNYVESSDISTDLSRLRAINDGYMDELHTLRNTYGADLVSLIENEPRYCGVAYRMTSLSASFSSSAFSVVHHSCATGYYSFGHEIGHNQGAHHDTANASGAIFSYAYGYQQANDVFRTVMAYNCPGGCIRVSHFSNSNILYNGLPTGYPNDTENASAIENTSSVVANFRQGVNQTPPQSPTNLSSSAMGPNQIELDWTDQSSNESGFVLERSEDGTQFSQFASVPENTTNYTDADLQPDTQYDYRIGAWNSSGQSGYSNVATATTDPAAQYIDQLAVAELAGSGSISGTFQDTWSLGGANQSITETNGPSPTIGTELEHYWILYVQPGAVMTFYADVATTGSGESFTFAYSTNGGNLSEDTESWVDMFTVSDQNSGTKQFTLPQSLSGMVSISVRDNTRTEGVITYDTLIVDYLSIRTEFSPGEAPEPSGNGSEGPIAPGC
ncbi:MAG: M12 family metallo-peptidase [Halioglobus sp.]|nr:M12 family metallo-peptidase [Halioglobus sp.]